jgi:hypothetical protein
MFPQYIGVLGMFCQKLDFIYIYLTLDSNFATILFDDMIQDRRRQGPAAGARRP